MVDSSPAMSDLSLNTFLTPNFYVDQCMAFLTSEEWAALMVVVRYTFGTPKQEALTANEIASVSGAGSTTTRIVLANLTRLGLLIQVQPYVVRLQTDFDQVDLIGLRARWDRGTR